MSMELRDRLGAIKMVVEDSELVSIVLKDLTLLRGILSRVFVLMRSFPPLQSFGMTLWRKGSC
jgi:hypothetical protein